MSALPDLSASSPSRRCGMCSACNSMPPWAPERIRLLSAQQRDELLRRMAEKQRRFIERRDARMRRHTQSEQEPENQLNGPNLGAEELEEQVPDGQTDGDARGLTESDDEGDEPVVDSQPADIAHRTIGDMLQQQSPQTQATDAPLHAVPLRDTDSDADSFHTAEENGEQQQRLRDEVPQPQSEEAKLSDLIQSVDFQQLNVSDVTSEPYKSPQSIDSNIITKGSSESDAATLSASLPHPLETASLTTQESTPFQTGPNPQHLAHLPSENLEDTVSARRQTRTHIHEKSFLERYDLPPDLVPLRSEISLQSSPIMCSDCERWRARVQELELKVEALTSALTAREMETSAMRARVAAGRNQRMPKTTAQLTEECENLRFTTEFLFHKLERYEREEAEKNDHAR